MQKTAVFPGSFDPFTVGHEDIVLRALDLFDFIIVAIGVHSMKQPLMKIEARVKMINKVFSDGQLDECELTLKDLHEIAKSFNNTLSGIFHQRIEYPDQALKHNKKGKNGNTDYGHETDQRPGKSNDQGEAGEGLKRLGLS